MKMVSTQSSSFRILSTHFICIYRHVISFLFHLFQCLGAVGHPSDLSKSFRSAGTWLRDSGSFSQQLHRSTNRDEGRWRGLSAEFHCRLFFLLWISSNVQYLFHHTKQISFSSFLELFFAAQRQRPWRVRVWKVATFTCLSIWSPSGGATGISNCREAEEQIARWVKVLEDSFKKRSCTEEKCNDKTWVPDVWMMAQIHLQQVPLLQVFSRPSTQSRRLCLKRTDMLDSPFRAQNYRGTFWTTAMFGNANLSSGGGRSKCSPALGYCFLAPSLFLLFATSYLGGTQG